MVKHTDTDTDTYTHTHTHTNIRTHTHTLFCVFLLHMFEDMYARQRQQPDFFGADEKVEFDRVDKKRSTCKD